MVMITGGVASHQVTFVEWDERELAPIFALNDKSERKLKPGDYIVMQQL